MFSNMFRSSFRPTAAALCSSSALYAFKTNTSNCESNSPIMKIGEGYKRPNDNGRNVKSFNEQWQSWAYKTKESFDPILASTLSKYEGKGWTRIDDVSVRRIGNANHMKGQAIKDSLAIRAEALPCYRMFLREDGKELVVVVQCVNGTSGHTNILHGGIAALLFDEAMGWMAGAARLREVGKLDIIRDPSSNPLALKELYRSVGFTAFLHVNYRRPAMLTSKSGQGDGVCVLTCRDTEINGRKLFLKAKLTNHDGSVLYSDAETLYIKPR